MRAGVLIAVAGLIASTAGAGPQVRAYVERTTVSLNRPFIFWVEIDGSNIGQPQIPDVDGVNINRQASQTRQSIQIINSESKTMRSFGFYAQATKLGRLTIPPISIEVDGKTLQTEPIVLNVVGSPQEAAAAGTDPQSQQGQSARTTRTGNAGERELTWDDIALATAEVSKKDVYQGEAVQLTLELWVLRNPNLDVGSAPGQKLEYPSSEGFYAATMDATRTQKERNGLQYDVTQFHQVLYPTRSGDLTIGSWHWDGYGRYNFFNSKELSLNTRPIVISVKPLPEGAPPNFSGAVGSFTVKASLDSSQMTQGVPTPYVVRITGRGNPDAILAPILPKVENAQVSDPEKEVKPSVTGGEIAFEKTFTYAITPQVPGDLVVPSFDFCYFDPVAGAYKNQTVESVTATVFATNEKPATVVVSPALPDSSGHVNVIGVDILPIVTEAGSLRPAHAIPGGTGVLYAVPVMAYAGVALVMRRRRRFEQDTGYARAYSAKSRSYKRLKNVAAASEPSEELFKALAGFVADKFNVPEAGMTSSDVRPLFEQRGIDPDLVDNFTRILRACERARYASARLSPEEVRALSDGAVAAMDRLEADLKRERRA